MVAGQLPMTGGCVSLTVTVNVHGVPLLSQVTEVVPMGKKDPDGGSQNIGSLPQLPDLVGNVATAPHWPGSLALVMLGHVIVHGAPVVTVTVKLQFPVLLQVTVVVPTGKLEPEGGAQVTGGAEHAVGVW